MLLCDHITKSFGRGRLRHTILRDACLHCDPGAKCVLLGPSGSGKTTLLSILGCVLSPCSGRIHLNGADVDFANKSELARLRRTRIGYVFQHANLFPFLTVEQNVRIVARNVGLTAQDSRNRFENLCERLQIGALRDKLPEQLSGGERQRVAIARAVIHRPPVVLADEPTAALDWNSGKRVIELLTEMVSDDNSILLTVTHDTRLVEFFDRSFYLECGVLQEEAVQ